MSKRHPQMTACQICGVEMLKHPFRICQECYERFWTTLNTAQKAEAFAASIDHDRSLNAWIDAEQGGIL